MKNRYFYNGNLINALKTFGICKVMSDLVFPYYGMKNACEENEIGADCPTCMALYALWLDAEASPDLQLKTAKDDDCGCGGDCKCKKQRLEYDYINDDGIPVFVDDYGNHCSATTGEILIDPDEQEACEPEDRVLFYKEVFETGEVGIRCASYEDAVSLCHILKNMGYKGADLEKPEEYKIGSFYTYGVHDGSVFLFDASFIPYFEGTSGKKIDEAFMLIDYDKIDFLPKEPEAPEEPQGVFRDPIFPVMLGGLEGFGLGIL